MWAAAEITHFQELPCSASLWQMTVHAYPQSVILRNRLGHGFCIWYRQTQSQQLAEELWALWASEKWLGLPAKWGRQLVKCHERTQEAELMASAQPQETAALGAMVPGDREGSSAVNPSNTCPEV